MQCRSSKFNEFLHADIKLKYPIVRYILEPLGFLKKSSYVG
jgi:hypothetical protein